ncbi:MAG: hypothetical protein RDU76_06175 [Candidatus Edwardsbacteria bacterium]|nr:hypothetical protein [Candidatus Edwardsbacteria bacterium]
MKIAEIKKKLLEWHDFFGGDLLWEDEIKRAKTKVELGQILERHRMHMEDMLSDAKSHLDSFKEEIGLNQFAGEKGKKCQ